MDRKIIAGGFILLFAVVVCARAEEACDLVKDAVIIAQDDESTPLGKVTNANNKESIFNSRGLYGSERSPNSIWNRYGLFGSPFSPYSPLSESTQTPPKIIKDGKFLGYLTANTIWQPSIHPELIREGCKNEISVVITSQQDNDVQ